MLQSTLESEREFIEQLNRDQLFEGKKASGEDMPLYSPNSRSRFAPNNIKLLDTGDFYKGITAEFDTIGVELTGLDEKTAELVVRYGFILGLTEESISLLRAKVVPLFVEKVRKFLGS